MTRENRSLVSALAACASLWLLTVPVMAQEPGSAAALLDPFLEEAFSLELTPGMAVAVVKDGEVAYLRGFGHADLDTGRPVTPETVFYIASSTKSFTGLSAAILHERGELDLDAPLSRYLPGLKMHEGLSADAITLRDLLTHTHGIANNGPVSYRAAFSGDLSPEIGVELVRHHPPAESGRGFRYGNIGYNIASLAMDAALHAGWKDVLQRELFDPLGMSNTSGYVSRFDELQLAMPHGMEPDGLRRLRYGKADANMHAAGGLVTTASDLARWLEANLSEGRIGGEQILIASAVAEAQRPQVEQQDEFFQFERTGYGLGWNTGSYGDESFTHHFGGFSGFHAHVSFMRERGVGVAILTNASSGTLLADLAARYIYDTLLEVPGAAEAFREELEAMPAQVAGLKGRIKADRDRRAARPQELPHPLEAYAGVFENEAFGRIELKVVDGRLEARMGQAWSEVEVYDDEKNMLRIELTGGGTVVPVTFEDGSQRASSIQFLRREFRRVD